MILMIALLPMFGIMTSAINTSEEADITHLVNEIQSFGNWRLNTSRHYWELDTLNIVRLINGGSGLKITSVSDAESHFQDMGRGRQSPFPYDETFFEDNFLLVLVSVGNWEINSIRDFGNIVDFEMFGTYSIFSQIGSVSPTVSHPVPDMSFEIPRTFLDREFSLTIYAEITRFDRDGNIAEEWVSRNGERVDSLPGRPAPPVGTQPQPEPQPPVNVPPQQPNSPQDSNVDETISPQADEEDLSDDYQGIRVFIDGERLKFYVLPTITNDRTLVPFRAIFEALDMAIEWDSDTRTAIGESEEVRIELPIDSATAYVNGEAVTLDVPAMLHNERTMVPLRFIAEATGADVEWDEDTQTVLISTD